MRTVQETVEIAVPVRTAYNQWTQFTVFPRFTRTVRHVDQVTPALTSWTVALGPLRTEFQAEIAEQEPDAYLVWRSLGASPAHRGRVTFEPTADGGTAVTVRMDLAPAGRAGLLAAVPALPGRVVRGELLRFKRYIEGLGAESGAWRGTIRGGRPKRPEPERHESGVPHWPVG
ncbi:hypothetical protein SZN_13661 [Streptomyces zinciresistens K42]|uniref:Coenzyme Q-binding protein COQ10 START domain-containing protein n=1 Tax=Streptomyces zinciresistens K42 TaxID=700597 RepID=G2GB76_9ACTN|nr:SRPBCC family protein [Streptomyces zinciresistens]EGX59253.1 hypothetical protein SZN_13661 [Streptomyces zinciresistens K42]